jgi:hypothetical protein
MFWIYWTELRSIGESFSSLEPIVDYGIGAKVMSSKSISHILGMMGEYS